MQHRKRIIIPIVLVLAIGALTIWYLVGGRPGGWKRRPGCLWHGRGG